MASTWHELDRLTYDECLALLATQRLGRVAYSADALPEITPVNYVLDGSAVVFRTAQGSRLAAATRDAVVAFEVDSTGGTSPYPWSVVVTGMARAITAPSELLRAQQLDLTPQAPGERTHFVRIVPAAITGRRLPALRPV